MKHYFLILVLFLSASLSAQDLSKFKAYNPADNAEESIAKAVKEAKASNKHVLIQIGGNWCIWCARFDDMVKTDKSIDSLVNAEYVTYHLNYSKENMNGKILAKYGFPQRFGFPVFLIIDGSGKLIHTQNSALLEAGKDQKGYNRQNVWDFFTNWSTSALDPAQYKEQ